MFRKQLVALRHQVLRHLLVHVLEDGLRPRDLPIEQRALALGLLLRRGDLGLEFLLQHLVAAGVWSDAQHEALQKELEAEIAAAQKQAERQGTLLDGQIPRPETIFEDVYEQMPKHLVAQRDEMLSGH